jgi:hypothetical protein
MFWAVMAVALLVNIFACRYLNFLNKICLCWTAASILIVMIVTPLVFFRS